MTYFLSTECLYFNPVSLALFFYSPSHFINTVLASISSFLTLILHRYFLRISFLTLIRRQTQSSAARKGGRLLADRLSESAATFVRRHKNGTKTKKDNKLSNETITENLNKTTKKLHFYYEKQNQ